MFKIGENIQTHDDCDYMKGHSAKLLIRFSAFICILNFDQKLFLPHRPKFTLALQLKL